MTILRIRWKCKILIMIANCEKELDWLFINELQTFWPELAENYRKTGWFVTE